MGVEEVEEREYRKGEEECDDIWGIIDTNGVEMQRGREMPSLSGAETRENEGESTPCDSLAGNTRFCACVCAF